VGKIRYFSILFGFPLGSWKTSKGKPKYYFFIFGSPFNNCVGDALSVRLVLVSDPNSVSPFFWDKLLVSILHFVYVDRGKRGSMRRGLYHERSKEANLFQIYNMDSINSVELNSYIDSNELSFPRRKIFVCLEKWNQITNSISVGYTSNYFYYYEINKWSS